MANLKQQKSITTKHSSAHSTQSSIQRIKQLLAQLTKKAQGIDAANAKLSAHKLLQDKALFAQTLFNTNSDQFTHYVKETCYKTETLARLLNTNNDALAKSLLEQIEQQINALSTALNANEVLHYNGQYRLDRRKAFFKAKNKLNKYKKAAKSIIQSSQNLYQKLAEHHEFERRLATMIAQREFQREKCNNQKAQILVNEILKLHQRLGRCRQAISLIERDIERSEKRS